MSSNIIWGNKTYKELIEAYNNPIYKLARTRIKHQAYFHIEDDLADFPRKNGSGNNKKPEKPDGK